MDIIMPGMPTQSQTVVYKASSEDQSSRPDADKTIICETTSIYDQPIRFGDKINQLEMIKSALNQQKTAYNNALKEVKDAATILGISGAWDTSNNETLL
jgi:hypothetical protein